MSTSSNIFADFKSTDLSSIPLQVSPPILNRDHGVKRHSFSSIVGSTSKFLGKIVLRVAVIATAILLSPVLVFAWGVANLSYAISKKSAFRKDLVTAREEMKQTEETLKFEALKDIYTYLEPQEIKQLTSTTSIANSLGDLTIKQNKVVREILRTLVRLGTPVSSLPLDDLKKACGNLKNEDFANPGALKKQLSSIFEELKIEGFTEDQYKKILNELNLKQPEKSAAELSRAIKKIIDVFNSEPKDIQKANRQITAFLREALESSAYIALKESLDSQAIRFLHSLAAGIWNKTKAFEAYQKLGKACLPEGEESPSNGSELQALLYKSHAVASQKLLTDHGLKAKIFYALTHPAQALSSLASEGGFAREIADCLGYGTYDSHGNLSNNPSLQGITSALIEYSNGRFESSVSGEIYNCYGGSPTQGDHKIAPEFRAVCQAAENNLSSSYAHKKISGIPDMVYYTNLQNIEGRHGEGDRSYTIMSLSYDLPLSFRGMTLAKDSEFYMMRKNRTTLTWDLEKFCQEFFTKFQDDACYTFEGRQGKKEGSGIYLPGSKQEWEPVLAAIFNAAEDRFSKFAKEPTTNSEKAYKLRGAFMEYVYSMIQTYMEVNLLREMQAKKSYIPMLMTISACKENIDRGGMENAKKLYTRISPDTPKEEVTSLVTGAMQARALSTRNRVILPSRMPQVLAFMEYIDQESFQSDMEKAFKGIGFEIQAFEFCPAKKILLHKKSTFPSLQEKVLFVI